MATITLSATAPLFTFLSFQAGWHNALEVLIGTRAFSDINASPIPSATLAVIGYLAVPISLGLLISTLVQRSFERQLLTEEEVRDSIRNRLVSGRGNGVEVNDKSRDT